MSVTDSAPRQNPPPPVVPNVAYRPPAPVNPPPPMGAPAMPLFRPPPAGGPAAPMMRPPPAGAPVNHPQPVGGPGMPMFRPPPAGGPGAPMVRQPASAAWRNPTPLSAYASTHDDSDDESLDTSSMMSAVSYKMHLTQIVSLATLKYLNRTI